MNNRENPEPVPEPGTDPNYLPGSEFEELLSQEKAFIGATDPDELKGLAISGGGIRSASFSMGIMQALVREGLLEKFDYLSTVSGGGYLGSSLTWFLKQGLPGGEPAGTTVEDFPFGVANKGSRGDSKQRNNILNYIRQHASYLVPTQSLNYLSLLAVALRSSLVSLGVYFSLLMVTMLSFMLLHLLDNTYTQSLRFVGAVPNLALLLALAGCTVFVLASFMYSLATWKNILKVTYETRVLIQGFLGKLLSFSLVLGLLGSIPLLFDRTLSDGTLLASSGAGSVVIGIVLAFMDLKIKLSAGKSTDWVKRQLPAIAAVLLLYGLLMLAFYCAQMLMGLGGTTDLASSEAKIAWIFSLCFFLLFGCITNINYLGLHRMYRDRLMELFMPSAGTVTSGVWHRATEADSAGIETMCQHSSGQFKPPYHLINTNVVLVDSKQAALRGRGGDSFILSPLYCGSQATGWCRSSHYMKRAPSSGAEDRSWRGRGMTLPTAMAISGAAMNPNTAVSGRGVTRSRLVSTLMALLNFRMGYWAANPARYRYWHKWMNWPNFVDPGLAGGVLWGGMAEDRRLVELTDGGHFENLAAYELIRRQVKFIMLCDGGADPDFNFSDLANLTERVRVDFGAKISFEDKCYSLDNLLPGSGGDSDTALNGFALGKIRFSGEKVASGKLVYIKTTMIPNLPMDVKGYKIANPSFPDEATSDQFFDEVQFEAYRELGYHIGWQWIKATKT